LLDSLCLFGGGRWSRVLLSVLLQNYPKLQIIWISKYGYENNLDWLQKQKVNQVLLTLNENQAWDLKPQAAIIATASHLHSYYVKAAISRKIPVLSEKPFALNVNEAQELIKLSELMKVVVGVNFEFMYASYLQDFAQHLKNIAVCSIDVFWQDAMSETRYGEKKMGDIYTPLMHDSFQHCWSLLRFLFPRESLSITEVFYNKDASVIVKALMFKKTINICLSRRAAQRVRKISINGGRLILDFALEPGILVSEQKIIQNEWKGNRPIHSVFEDFFKRINKPQLISKWPLNIKNCLEAIQLSVQATTLLEQSQKKALAQKYPLNVEDPITRNLLVDLFLPQFILDGEYHRAHNLEEQLAFSNYVINHEKFHLIK
jgi:predicted dehydrogenase